MNEDILQGQWKQMQGKVHEWWGKLTDDDLAQINGQRDQLIGKLQEHYGYTRERATQEVDARLKTMKPMGSVER